jgi:hypothetical protein
MPRSDRSRAGSRSAASQLALDVAGGTIATTLVAELTGWLDEPRFRAFVEANRPKVRRKFRDARTAETLRDVRLELRLAGLLLADRRFDLGFETYGRGRVGPDFTLTFRGGRPTDLELTRRRPTAGAEVNPYEAPILAKLRQLQPSVPSVLVIATEAAGGGQGALDSGARTIVDHAEAADEAWFARHGIASMRVFWGGFHRLGAVVAWREDAEPDDRSRTWVNPNARIPVARPLLSAIERSLRAAM